MASLLAEAAMPLVSVVRCNGVRDFFIAYKLT
jgi:hypothetical protein